jgi:XTP/dITP diphosphohydrolase
MRGLFTLKIMKTKLCFATNNAHKLEEIQAILGDSFELISLAATGCTEELPETGNTLEANSLQKAQYLYDHYQVNCFADDSGLEVQALGGEPGVDSAHYAGPQRSHADNVNLLLKNLADKTDRSAQFKTVITLIQNGEITQFQGSIKGHIISELKGSKGFGYDPIFVPEGYETTFAEMSLEEKGEISARGRAFAKLVDFLGLQ